MPQENFKKHGLKFPLLPDISKEYAKMKMRKMIAIPAFNVLD